MAQGQFKTVRIGERVAETAVPAAAAATMDNGAATAALMAKMMARLEALETENTELKAAPVGKAAKAAPVAFDPLTGKMEHKGEGWNLDVAAGTLTMTVDLTKGERQTGKGNRGWTIATSHGALWIRAQIVFTPDGMPLQRKARKVDAE